MPGLFLSFARQQDETNPRLPSQPVVRPGTVPSVARLVRSGREVIRLVCETIGEESMLLLLSAPTARSYYPYIGFEELNSARDFPRKR